MQTSAISHNSTTTVGTQPLETKTRGTQIKVKTKTTGSQATVSTNTASTQTDPVTTGLPPKNFCSWLTETLSSPLQFFQGRPHTHPEPENITGRVVTQVQGRPLTNVEPKHPTRPVVTQIKAKPEQEILPAHTAEYQDRIYFDKCGMKGVFMSRATHDSQDRELSDVNKSTKMWLGTNSDNEYFECVKAQVHRTVTAQGRGMIVSSMIQDFEEGCAPSDYKTQSGQEHNIYTAGSVVLTCDTEFSPKRMIDILPELKKWEGNLPKTPFYDYKHIQHIIIRTLFLFQKPADINQLTVENHPNLYTNQKEPGSIYVKIDENTVFKLQEAKHESKNTSPDYTPSKYKDKANFVAYTATLLPNGNLTPKLKKLDAQTFTQAHYKAD
ncbi:MAG: hypothetical protein ACPG5T_02440 [Endozoicomonas sp.]